MIKKFRNIMLTALFVFGLVVTGFGQETTGSLEGTVKDSSGALVPGATVIIQGNAFRRSVQTNDEGYYRVLAVPPGNYNITARRREFRNERTDGGGRFARQATPIDFGLQPAGVGATVNVTSGDVATIDSTSSRVQTNLTEERFEPTSERRKFFQRSGDRAVGSAEPKGAGFQIDGSSGAENTFIVDGQEVTNFRTGQLNTNNNLPFELIQEVQIKTGGFEAEHGGATGGVITLVTKRGGNEFSGNVNTHFNRAS